MSNTYCCVFALFFFVLCTLCCSVVYLMFINNDCKTYGIKLPENRGNESLFYEWKIRFIVLSLTKKTINNT